MRLSRAYATDPDSALKNTTASEIDVKLRRLLVRVDQQQHRHEHEAAARADERPVRADDEPQREQQQLKPRQVVRLRAGWYVAYSRWLA